MESLIGAHLPKIVARIAKARAEQIKREAAEAACQHGGGVGEREAKKDHDDRPSVRTG